MNEKRFKDDYHTIYEETQEIWWRKREEFGPFPWSLKIVENWGFWRNFIWFYGLKWWVKWGYNYLSQSTNDLSKFPKYPYAIWNLFQIQILLKNDAAKSGTWLRIAEGAADSLFFNTLRQWASCYTHVTWWAQNLQQHAALGSSFVQCLGPPWGPLGWSSRSHTQTSWTLVHSSRY